MIIGTSWQLYSQGSGLPLNSDDYRIAERLEIKSGVLPPYHAALKMWTRGGLVKYALYLDTLENTLDKTDRKDLERIFLDNNEWLSAAPTEQTLGGKKSGTYEKIKSDTLYRFIPAEQVTASLQNRYYFKNTRPVWGLFYPTPANWVEINKPAFHLRISPIIALQAAAPNEGKMLFINKRGVELRGGIDDRIYFYSNITDTQGRFPEYVNEYINRNKALPGNGFYKAYKSSVFDSEGAYDWLNGQGYLGFNLTPSVGMQLGHGQHFVGNGYRSLLLSDFAHNYFYLKINWKFWRFHYQNIFGELSARSAQSNPGDEALPKKYFAAHYLGLDISHSLSIGLYEAVVFDRRSSTERFELQYLNPVILYRTVEHLLDSEDNVLIGLNIKWDLFRRIRLYGQLLLDEFKSSEIFTGDGWWANKFGGQLGVRYIDAFGLGHLDLGAEWNSVRPFTYTHSDETGSSYSHYNQALAHPLGANFRELIASVRYQPALRWTIEARYFHYLQGEEPPNENWGTNILLPNTSRVQDYGFEIGHPFKSTVNLLRVDLSWEIFHNLYFDLHYFFRKKESELSIRNFSDNYFGAGVRLNSPIQRFDF